MLDVLPYEVLENVAFWLANDLRDGCYYCSSSTSTLLALLLTCKSIHDDLLGAPARGHPANYALLASLYEVHFDKDAFERRWRIKLSSAQLASEYKKRICLLKRINHASTRTRDPDQFDNYRDNGLFKDLWTVLLMTYEDEGNNLRQLFHAGVEGWVTSIILDPESKPFLQLDDKMWPVESEYMRLSYAISSLLSTIESVTREDPEIREGFLAAFQYFLVAPHKYTMFHLPITTPSPPRNPNFLPPQNDTLPVMGPSSYSEPWNVEHFGLTLRLVSPRIAESALCAMNLRRERIEIAILPNTPENRAQAEALGRFGPTKEDHRENLFHRAQALGSEVPHAGSKRERENLACLQNPLRGSKRFDIDFWRLCSVDWTLTGTPRFSQCWYNTVYTVGILSGKWFGRLQMPFFEDFLNMVQAHPSAPSWVDMVAQPMQFFLREHVTTDTAQKISYGLGDSSVLNAYFPSGVDPSKGQRARETSTEFEVLDPSEPVSKWARKVYQSVDAGVRLPEGKMPPPPIGEEQTEDPSTTSPDFPEEVEMDMEQEFGHPMGPHPDVPGEILVEYDSPVEEETCVDVCVTGETGHNYGQAYGAFKVYGRVRSNDGLIVLVRVPVSEQSGYGRWVFSGYLRASATIVGQWRETGRGMNGIGYGGTFMITKVGDMWGAPVPPSAGPSTH